MSARRSEELEGVVVGVAEGETRAVGGVDDPAVGNAQVVEPGLPLLELAPAGYAETDVVEAGAQLAERLVALRVRMLVDPEEASAVEYPHDVVEQAGVLVEHRLRVKESLVPRPAGAEVVDRHRHMSNPRKPHQAPPLGLEPRRLLGPTSRRCCN